MEKHPYGNSLIRDFYLKNDEIAQEKKTPIEIFTFVFFFISIKCLSNLPLKMQQRSYFFKNMNAIYKITART